MSDPVMTEAQRERLRQLREKAGKSDTSAAVAEPPVEQQMERLRELQLKAEGAGPELAAIRGAKQGATYGFADEAEAGLTSLLGKVSPGAARWMSTPIGSQVDETKPVDYSSVRDEIRGVE